MRYTAKKKKRRKVIQDTSLPISAHTCFLSVSALTPCVFHAASLPLPSTANCCTNMAAPPKDTIYAYWRATLLVTKGQTVKILNLWRTRALPVPKYAEKAQKRCCVLCVWLYLLPSSSERWPKGHSFIGLRCWLPHNVQKSLLFQTYIKAGLRMQHYPHDTHIQDQTHICTRAYVSVYICVCACVCVFWVRMPVCSRAGTTREESCGLFIRSKVAAEKRPAPVFKAITLPIKVCLIKSKFVM